jgi:tetratricopeptide (TPR) repeat protein
MNFKLRLAVLALTMFSLSGQASPAKLIELGTADWLAQAGWLEKQRDWPNLLVWGQTWSQLQPQQAAAWFVQGRALSELQRPQEAIAAYLHNLRLDPNDLYAHHNLGNLYRKQRLHVPAMQAYREALRVNPDYIPAWHNLGLAYYEHKGVEGVGQALRQLHASDPALAEAWRKLAVDYALSRDERVAQEAVRMLKNLDPAKREHMFAILFPPEGK